MKGQLRRIDFNVADEAITGAKRDSSRMPPFGDHVAIKIRVKLNLGDLNACVSALCGDSSDNLRRALQ